MIRVPNDEYAAILKEQLEKRGFQVVEIVPAPASSPQPGSDD
jgi:hypothetical protein